MSRDRAPAKGVWNALRAVSLPDVPGGVSETATAMMVQGMAWMGVLNSMGVQPTPARKAVAQSTPTQAHMVWIRCSPTGDSGGVAPHRACAGPRGPGGRAKMRDGRWGNAPGEHGMSPYTIAGLSLIHISEPTRPY